MSWWSGLETEVSLNHAHGGQAYFWVWSALTQFKKNTGGSLFSREVHASLPGMCGMSSDGES